MSPGLPIGTLLPAAGLPSSSSGSITPGSIARGIAGTIANFAAPGSGTAVFGPHSGARFVTGLLGILLIAAAIFTHPTVVNIGKKAARAAGEAAAA